VKKYIVKLSEEEGERLNTLIQKGKSSGRQMLKARILLRADAAPVGEAWSGRPHRRCAIERVAPADGFPRVSRAQPGQVECWARRPPLFLITDFTTNVRFASNAAV
jgi:hypothetical protein